MPSKAIEDLLKQNSQLTQEDLLLLEDITLSKSETDSRSISVVYLKSSEAVNALFPYFIEGVHTFSVDLEFDDNRYSYGRTISLIQIFNGNAVFLIDVISIDDLSQVYQLLEDESIEKIFHSCASDLNILNEVAQCSPKNIHDTSLMYSLLLESKDSISLSRLLEQKAGIKLKKEAQASNWVKRPLSESQLSYAALDVLYLPTLKTSLEKELKNLDRTHWYEQDRKALESIQHESRSPAKRLARKNKLSRFKTILLETYWEVADRLAQKLDKPNYRVIDNKLLIYLVENPPTSRKDWEQMRGGHPRLKRQPYLSQLMDAKSIAEERYQKSKEEGILKSQLPNAMKWRSYKKHDEIIIDRGLLFDLLRERLAEHKGDSLQALVMPGRIKSNMIWEGLTCLTPWKKEVIEELAKDRDIDIESIRFSLVSQP